MPHRVQGKYVILIDDDFEDLEVLKSAIQDGHFAAKVDYFSDPQVALESLQTKKQHLPDVVIVDANMPQMNGLSVLKQIRADGDFQKVKVVILSTYIPREQFELYTASGADLIMLKPDTFAGYKDVLIRIFSKG